MLVLKPTLAPAVAAPATGGGELLRSLRKPPSPADGGSAAANNIVRFLRTRGLPAPPPAQLAQLAAGLAAIGRQMMSFAPAVGAIATVLTLGGDSPQRFQPATQLLPRLMKGRANLDQTFEALNDLVTTTTPWPDVSGQRAALQSLLMRSRQQIQRLAVSRPDQAVRQLATLFEVFELRNGSAGPADEGRLAAAREILALRRLAPAAKPRQASPAAQSAATPVAEQAPPARPRSDPAVAAARTRFKAVQAHAGGLNRQVLTQQSAAAAGWEASRAPLARFYWQAAGGRAALPALRGALNEVETSLRTLRTVYRQANAPAAALKASAQELGQIAASAGGNGLAPQTAQARAQVAGWAQAADAWRSRLSEQINELAQWKQAAQQYAQTLAAPGAVAGQASMPPLPALPGGVAPKVAQAARAAQEALRVPSAPAATQAQPPALPQVGQATPKRPPASLPDGEAHVRHTGPVGTAEEIAARQKNEAERALKEAAAIYYGRLKTLLTGGDQATLAETVYNGTKLQALGVSLTQFRAHLQAGQEPEGAAGARVRSGAQFGGASAVATYVREWLPSNDSLGKSLRRLALSEQRDVVPMHDGTVRVVPDGRASDYARKSYELLVRDFGAVAVDLLTAAALGYRGEVGILSISRLLQESAGGEPLLPKHLAAISGALFSLDGTYDALGGIQNWLHDIEHLAGFEAAGGSMRGVYPTSIFGEKLAEAMGSQLPRRYDWADVIAEGLLSGRSLEQLPAIDQMFDRLAVSYRIRQFQHAFDGHFMPWLSTRSDVFLETWARLHAVAVSLAMAPGVNLAGLSNQTASAVELARRGPVNQLDLAVVYPETFEYLLDGLRKMRARARPSSEHTARIEPFAQSARFQRLYGALFPAHGPDDLRQSLLHVLEKRAFGSTGGGGLRPPKTAQDDAARQDEILDLTARGIALDPEFFMVGGNLRAYLALEAFEGWLTRRANARDPLLKPEDIARIMGELRAADDPLRGIRERLEPLDRTRQHSVMQSPLGIAH
jgi:hypothetical protein